jgi:RNA-binding protein
MKPLTSAQRKRLRSLAHHLKPVLQVGKAGLSDSFLAAVEESLACHELIKIKFLTLKPEKKTLALEISRRTKSEVTGLIGHTLILYRQQEDPEKRRVRLS